MRFHSHWQVFHATVPCQKNWLCWTGNDGRFLRFSADPTTGEPKGIGPSNLRWFLMWWYHVQQAGTRYRMVQTHVNWFMMLFTCAWLDDLVMLSVIFVFFHKAWRFWIWVLLLKAGRSQHRLQPAIFRPKIGLEKNKKCVELSVGFLWLRLDVKDGSLRW